MFKFDITFLNTFLLFTNSLYVDTNFEFSVTSVVVIEFVASCVFSPLDVANTNVVDAVYIGFINPIVYIPPIIANKIINNMICIFLFQKNHK